MIYYCENCTTEIVDTPSSKRRFCSNRCKTLKQYERPENHWHYQGKAGNTAATHRWVGRTRVKPNECDWCGAPERKARDSRSLLFWANLSGEYLRDLNDWACLCMNCHWKLDNQIAKLLPQQMVIADDPIKYLGDHLE